MHTLIRKEYINENLFKIYFDKRNLEFIPGQHFSLSIPNKSINREYSSYTAANEEELGFLIRRIEGGIMTNILDKLNIGEQINIYGPYGSFVLRDDFINSKKVIFICSGTGIAPFVSIKKTYNLKNYILFQGVREAKDISEQKIFNESKSYYCISRENKFSQNNYYKGRVNVELMNLEFIKDYKNAIYMICGNSFMISDIYDLLVYKKNVDPNLIITESFF